MRWNWRCLPCHGAHMSYDMNMTCSAVLAMPPLPFLCGAAAVLAMTPPLFPLLRTYP